MPKFSTFSIYEKEVREYINLLASHTIIDSEKLTNWLYDEGINELRKGQATDYYTYVKECQSKFSHRPLISIQHSLGQHFAGLTSVQNALVKEFGQDNTSRQKYIVDDFNSLVLASINNHKEFIKIEAEISSEFNEYLDKNGDLSPVESLKKVIGLFEEKQDKYPNLQVDFKNKLTLMKEFLDELTKQNTNQFFSYGTKSESKVETISTHQATPVRANN